MQWKAYQISIKLFYLTPILAIVLMIIYVITLANIQQNILNVKKIDYSYDFSKTILFLRYAFLFF